MSEPSCIASCRRCEADGDRSAAMNDEFLHQIRVEPPPDFLERLKARLDLQPPPTTPRQHSTLGRVILGLLLTGSVFAITLFILNRGAPDASVNTEVKLQQEPAVATNNNTARAKPAPVAANNAARAVKKEILPNFTAITPKSLQPYLSY